MISSSMSVLEVSVGVSGIIVGTFLSGLLMSLYSITMPVLVQTSERAPLLLQQWKDIFDRGHIQGPVLAVTTSVMYACAALARASSDRSWVAFACAAGLTMGIVPYTWIFMSPINNALFDAVDLSSRTKSAVTMQDTQEMIALWSRLHGIRSLLPLAGAVMGCVAMLK